MKNKTVRNLIYEAVNQTDKKITFKSATFSQDFIDAKDYLINLNIAIRQIKETEKEIIFITNSKLKFLGIEK